ncbi:MAG: hypothetical protein EBZ31_06500 [Flavobacteriia bacterium]|nr:hypothetical protein [Flavobacteriia bacterium]
MCRACPWRNPPCSTRHDRIRATSTVDWAHWEIYSRWGQKVYESESYTQPWDGRMGSREAADGVYFIVVRAGNSDVPETVFARGSLHLMR